MQRELKNSHVFRESEGSENHHMMWQESELQIGVAESELDTGREGLSRPRDRAQSRRVSMKTKATHSQRLPLLSPQGLSVS